MPVPPARFSACLVALGLDVLFGEPPARAHPVVLMGVAIDRLGATAPAGRVPRLVHGAVHVALVGGASAVGAAVLGRGLRSWPPIVAMLTEGALLKTALSVRGLVEAAHRVERDLTQGRVDAVRGDVRALVSRETATLDQAHLASAAVESVAENAADSVLAPLLYYVVGGLPAAFAYRAVNTMDAMIGYHGCHEYSGKAAAKADDLLSFVPSRWAAGSILLGSALVGGDVGNGWQVLRRDGRRTESPNAGWPMSAMAGALGVRLEKPGAYALGSPLGLADAAAIDHAIQILYAATLVSLPALLALARWRAGAAR